MPKVAVYLVRHGETNENVQSIIQGQLDTELNLRGREQSRVVADRLKSVPFYQAFSSDLRRATDTGASILEHHSIPLILNPLLRERYMGSLEGKHVSKMNRRLLPPEVERGRDFCDRCLQFWDSVIIPLAKIQDTSSIPLGSGEIGGATEYINILVVTHGAWISSILHSGLVAERNYRGRENAGNPVYNTSVSIVVVDEDGLGGEVRMSGNIRHLLKPVVKRNVDVVDDQETLDQQSS
ncbi:hypothetical protein FRC03_009881 [Tulasnella sp. 419]|nr:hypothetical protein FRC03_009881 [Tulasnella sp. 419]